MFNLICFAQSFFKLKNAWKQQITAWPVCYNFCITKMLQFLVLLFLNSLCQNLSLINEN